ncbi:MAG: MFS transporter [Ketobacter sp.]|nr:MAG: MFS transporter [Ketobacter sp.]
MQTIIIKIRLTPNTHRISWAVSPMGLGQSAMLVFLPLLVEHTSISYSQWAQLFALGMGSYVVGSVVWPLLLPRWGHRLPLLLGLAGYSISMLLFAWVLWLQYRTTLDADQAYLGFACSRLLYGAFASALLPVTQSWCAELSSSDPTSSERLQAFSRISLQLALSRALGPVLAGLLGWLHWLWLPLVLAAWPLILISLLQSIPEPKVATSTPPPLRNMIPPLWLGSIALSTTAFASSLQFQLSPALTLITRQAAETVSLILAGLMVLAALFGVVAHHLQMRIPPTNPLTRILWIALLLLVCALGLLMSEGLWQFIAMTLLMSIGLAWLTPLYSTQLSLHQSLRQSRQPGHQHMVAAQLSLSHISGHLVGLTMTALALGQSLHCAYIWLATLAALIAVASLSKSVSDT